MLTFLWVILKFALWLILLVAFLTALTTHFILWFELRLKSLQGELPSRIPYFRLLKSLLIETACYFTHPLLLPLAFTSSSPSVSLSVPPSTIHHNATPVLLVHGYLQNKTDWLWFQRKLKKMPGIGPLYTLNLFPPFCSIAQHAKRIQKEIDRIKKATQQDTIILIGHSMGGLISSYYSEYLAEPGEVEKVIALGSPFHGSRLVALGLGTCVKEMAPGSRFLEQLMQQIQNSSTAYYYIGSRIDNLVIPWDSAFPPQHSPLSKNKLILEDHGHLRLLISPTVVHQVAKWIATPAV